MTTMTQTARRVIGGVDTHKDVHVAAVVDEAGRILGVESFANDTKGFRQMRSWMSRHGEIDRVGIEGTGSYGAGLARHFTRTGVEVLEVRRHDRQRRRMKGKSDTVDAEAAARARGTGHGRYTENGHRQRRGDPSVTDPEELGDEGPHPDREPDPHVGRHRPRQLREQLRGRSIRELVGEMARWRPGPPTDPFSADRYSLRMLASAGCRSLRRSRSSISNSPGSSRSPLLSSSLCTVSESKPPRRCSLPLATIPSVSTMNVASPRSAVRHLSTDPRAVNATTASTEAATETPTALCGGSLWSECPAIQQHGPTSNDEPKKANRKRPSSAVSSATSPENST